MSNQEEDEAEDDLYRLETEMKHQDQETSLELPALRNTQIISNGPAHDISQAPQPPVDLPADMPQTYDYSPREPREEDNQRLLSA